MARNCTDGDATRSSQLIGTVTGPAGGGGDAGIGGGGDWRSSGETGCEPGAGSGEIEGVTIVLLYAPATVPPEAR